MAKTIRLIVAQMTIWRNSLPARLMVLSRYAINAVISMNGFNGVNGEVETAGAAGSNIVCGKRPCCTGMLRIICTISHRNDIDWTDDARKL